ncbi:MAG: hypothetical protein SFW09_07780 [Hyphomicrobiaceae bacterium]|nr:hypothetical protein [Hyphomicrobiaceae bacterium]
MFGRVLRVLIGFIAACLGAGLAMVLFVVTPSDLMGLPAEVRSDRIVRALELAVYVAAQAALFAAPFALVAAAIGEWLENRSWSYYALAGILMAVLGFLAQHSTEQAGQPTIVNNYAVIAFVTSGFVGGLMYWLFSGRLSGALLPSGQSAQAIGGQSPATLPPTKAGAPAGKPAAAKPAEAATAVTMAAGDAKKG